MTSRSDQCSYTHEPSGVAGARSMSRKYPTTVGGRTSGSVSIDIQRSLQKPGQFCHIVGEKDAQKKYDNRGNHRDTQ